MRTSALLRGVVLLCLVTLSSACTVGQSVVGGGDASDLGPDLASPDTPDAADVDDASDVVDVVDVPRPVRCSAFERDCNGTCTDVGVDRTNCGACGRTCPGAQVCFAGSCVDLCPDGMIRCGDRCVDTRYDGANCGACGMRCPTDLVCADGRCAITCAVADGGAADGGVGVTECRVVEGERYCADLRIDRRNCGTCGTLCPLGQTCYDGTCQIACPPGQRNCGGTCVTPRTDRENCGACGVRCPTGQVCSEGACTLECGAPLIACGDGAARRCVDAQVDPTNCGTCGHTCAAGESCRAGVCAVTCPPGQSVCAGVCRDLASDSANCGMCGQSCGAGEVCRMGACSITCPTGFTVCAPAMSGGRSYCANLQTDASDCGGCGMVCPTGQSCVAGSCALVCTTGQIACAGLCRDPRSDNAHCGACGNACPTGQACVAGRCTVTCPGAQVACGLTCHDLQTDLADCGMCDVACPTPANAAAACAAGRCAFTCNAGFADCDGSATNGCETDLRASTAHCGRCGAACSIANGTAACNNGDCAVARCNTGRGDCNNTPDDGCEVDTTNTTAHCGGCGRACNLSNATTACVASACTVTACATGFADCDMNPANGCEVSVTSDNANCGTCGRTCPAGQICASGACTFSCPSGQAACSNGCFTLPSSTQHCGMCENACPARANALTLCAAGACTFRCLDGFADCDGTAANGCEVDTRTSAANCGMCGRACAAAHATPTCSAGVCGLGACDAGFADCDMNPANGCEVDTRSTVSSCGACGRVCSVANGTAGCAAGACTVAACATGFADCDTNPANGCEVDTRVSGTNCGMCGRVCATGQSCQASVCTALASCRAILAAAPSSANGAYAIDPDGAGGAAAFNVYCDMSGGGWTMIMMAGTDALSTLGYGATYWTTAAVLNATVTDPATNVSMKNAAFNTLGFDAMRFCLGTITSCMTETITVSSALALFMRSETSRARPVGDFAPWGYTGGLGCNRNGFNVFDVGGGPARYRYGILWNNESACEGSVDGGRGFGGHGYYGTEISAGQGDGIVSTRHERGWVFVR